MINTDKISNIIFDLGGVLLDIDYQNTIDAFIHLGFPNFSTFYSHLNANGFFEGWDTGKVTAHEFRKTLKNMHGNGVTDQQIDDAWNAMIFEFDPERLKQVLQLRSKYKVFLLSNINEIHYDAVWTRINQLPGGVWFPDLFDKMYFSHLMGRKKPNADSYLTVLNENGLKASETVFVDDLMPNIEGAKAVGLHTWHRHEGTTLLPFLEMMERK